MQKSDLRIVHVGAGRYEPRDRDHVTYGIWRELASRFGYYHVIARSRCSPADWTDGNLRISLIRSFGEREIEFLASQFALVGLIARARPDVIVCQSPVLGGLAALVAAEKTGARILVELHGAEYFEPAPFGSGRWLFKKLTKFALNRSASIRVLSPRMRDLVALTYGEKLLTKARILPPRVDLRRFPARTNKAKPSSPVRLAMVGAVNTNKGQLRLINALRSVRFELELNIVGIGSDLELVRHEAERLATSQSKLSIIAHGTLPHAAIERILRECDAFVMYSRSEGTPRAIMEAMAVGLPIISTDVGFCSDLFEHEREGLLLRSNPDEEVVRAVERLRDDASLAASMGRAAQERARRDYDSGILFEEYRRIIEETSSL